MATITVRVSEEEKKFLNEMAKFEGKSLSDLLRTATLDSLEDIYDAHIGDLAYEEYLQTGESSSLTDLLKKYEVTD